MGIHGLQKLKVTNEPDFHRVVSSFVPYLRAYQLTTGPYHGSAGGLCILDKSYLLSRIFARYIPTWCQVQPWLLLSNFSAELPLIRSGQTSWFNLARLRLPISQAFKSGSSAYPEAAR